MIQVLKGTERYVIDEVVNRFDIPRVDAEEIVNSQFFFVKHTMGEGRLEGVRLMYLGTFEKNKSRLDWIKKRNIKLSKNICKEIL